MNSKIKVNPRTFKIINQEKSIESSSESESLTSVNSDNDSVKVIKLDDSLQSGGKNGYMKQLQQQPQQIQVKKFDQSIKTSFIPTNNVLPVSTSLPSAQELPLTLPLSQPLSQPPSQQQSQQKNMEESYLRTAQLSDNSSLSSSSESSIEETKEEEIETEKPVVESNGSTDIIDLTKSQLHDVLFSNFTDSKGNNISENIEKMSKLFEAHNQIMEKILNQLIIMNSNYKQVTVSEAIQTNTKQAKTLNDFRKNTEKISNEN